MIMRRIPTRTQILQENDGLTVQVAMLNGLVDALINGRAKMIVVGHHMAGRLQRSSRPESRELAFSWGTATEILSVTSDDGE